MATVVETIHVRESVRISEQRILLRGISWHTYEALCREIGEHQKVRVAYDRGDLELMSPLHRHERCRKLLGRLVGDILVALDIPCQVAGSARWIRETAQRGLEADDSYFNDPRKLAIISGRAPGRPEDLLPDLAIEIELSEPQIDRMAIYGALGIPEVWRYDGERLSIDSLSEDGAFTEQPESRFLPIRRVEIEPWIRLGESTLYSEWIRILGEWIREEIVPRRVNC